MSYSLKREFSSVNPKYGKAKEQVFVIDDNDLFLQNESHQINEEALEDILSGIFESTIVEQTDAVFCLGKIIFRYSYTAIKEDLKINGSVKETQIFKNIADSIENGNNYKEMLSSISYFGFDKKLSYETNFYNAQQSLLEDSIISFNGVLIDKKTTIHELIAFVIAGIISIHKGIEERYASFFAFNIDIKEQLLRFAKLFSMFKTKDNDEITIKIYDFTLEYFTDKNVAYQRAKFYKSRCEDMLESVKQFENDDNVKAYRRALKLAMDLGHKTAKKDYEDLLVELGSSSLNS